jgi:hypothetical protein
MTFLGLIGLINTVAAAGLAVVVFLRSKRRDLAFAYSFANCSVAWWAFFILVWQMQTTPEAMVWPMRLLMIYVVCFVMWRVVDVDVLLLDGF